MKRTRKKANTAETAKRLYATTRTGKHLYTWMAPASRTLSA